MEQTGDQEEMSQEAGLCLGIDFGNSKISGAVWDSKKKAPSIVTIDGKYQFPATVYVSDLSGKNEIEHNLEAEAGLQESGEENNVNSSKQKAVELKAEVGVEYTTNKKLKYFVYDIKKLIGQRNTDEYLENLKNNLKYKIQVDQNDNVFCFDEKIPFENLAKFFIEKIKDSAEKEFESKVNSCTISVPHGFNFSQRNAIINAAKLAGITNVNIINDPLSTAIYYASQNKIQKKENFLIVDFGSSKLDISLLTINKRNSIKVILTGGDSTLGGDIFNFELQKDILESYKSEGGSFPDEQDPNYLIKLFLIEKASEKIKKQLTYQLEASITLDKLDGKTDLVYSIKRDYFDELNRENYAKIIKLINNIIKESKLPPQEIDHIILQGDALRVVTLTNLIKNEYQDCDIITDLYDSVAFGSAIYTAQKLNVMNNEQFKNFKIYDITPFSLGIRGEGDLMSVILPKGSRVPIKVMKYYITTQDNQTNIKFEIYGGERKLIKDNFSLDRIILKGLPQMNKGQVKIEVIFEVDENFILHVTARELSSNLSKSCDVIINLYLSQQQIFGMIEEAKKYSQEDMEEKERIQAMLRLNDKIFEYNHLYEGNEDILRELESYRNWIKHSSTALKEEYEQKLKELNDTMQKERNDTKTRKQTAKRMTNRIEEEKNPELK